MWRVSSFATAAAVMSFALAGCSSAPEWVPNWLASKPPAAELQALNFESEPPGAEVRTVQGQACVTPCVLSVPSQPQSITITKVGFVPQTVQVTVGPTPDHALWESPPPTLVPNPVHTVLEALPPTKPMLKKRHPKAVSAAPEIRAADKTTAPEHTDATDAFPNPGHM
jgi:PEGA domain